MFESACDFAARIFMDSLFLGNFEIQKRHIRATFISDNFIFLVAADIFIKNACASKYL